MEISKLTPGIGAEIHGLDLTRPISAADAAALRQAWQDHMVLIARDQHHVTPVQQIAFSAIFGELDVATTLSPFCHPDHPEIFVLTNEMTNGKPSVTRNIGWQWHTDLTYTTRPSAGAVMHARQVPASGGDTMFSNLCLAWETLSPAYRAMLEPLFAIHDFTQAREFSRRDPKAMAEMAARTPPVRQPVFWTHPLTGRRALMVNETVVTRFDGMTQEESAPILAHLFAHSSKPEFVYRHRWKTGDILIWDNFATMHKVVHDHVENAGPDHPEHIRKLHRVTLKGRPSGLALERAQAPTSVAA